MPGTSSHGRCLKMNKISCWATSPSRRLSTLLIITLFSLMFLWRYPLLNRTIIPSPTLLGQVRSATNILNMLTPKIISVEELPVSEAKWITLKKQKWCDPDGKERLWEYAERRTRGSSGIDAVAVLAVIRSKTNAFPLSTVVIEQYRPPIDKYIIELPAGLIDEGETPEKAAIRELEEETGFKADSVLESSPVIVSDPGMTNANMKLIVLSVPLEDQMETPDAKLDAGEFIVKRVVELAKLYAELRAYDTKGFIIDAKLSHFASGYEMAQRIRAGELS